MRDFFRKLFCKHTYERKVEMERWKEEINFFVGEKCSKCNKVRNVRKFV